MSRRAAAVAAPERPAYFTATLAKGLDILEALSGVEDSSLTELARRLRVSGPTLFRILATLAARGYAEKHPVTGRYRATLKSWALGAQVVRRVTLRDVARPYLETLLADTREAPHLAVLEGDGVVVIERLEAPHPVRVDTYVGQRAPAHCSATGKAILAFRPPPPAAATALARYTNATLSDPAALARDLALVRQRGYAVNQEEWRRGVCAIAVPLRGEGGNVVAALSLTMPTERFQRAGAPRRFLKPLTRAADGISTQLGAPARSDEGARNHRYRSQAAD